MLLRDNYVIRLFNKSFHSSHLLRYKFGPFLSRAVERSWSKTSIRARLLLADSSEHCKAQKYDPVVPIADLAPEALLYFSCSLLKSSQTVLQGWG